MLQSHHNFCLLYVSSCPSMGNRHLSLIIFTNASPCPKNQRGRKSGNHCQSWHFPKDGWHRRQISSSAGICRSKRLETNPLTNSDELSFGIIINVGGPRPNGLVNTYHLSPMLAPFQFFRYPKLLPASGLCPFCSFCLDFSSLNPHVAASF